MENQDYFFDDDDITEIDSQLSSQDRKLETIHPNLISSAGRFVHRVSGGDGGDDDRTLGYGKVGS